MPVYAQSCRRAPTAAPVDDPVARSIRKARPLLDADDAPLDELPSAFGDAKKLIALRSDNAFKFLDANGITGKHKFAGQNMSVKKGTETINGYVTSKGVFKPWPTDAFMKKTGGKYGCPAATVKPLPDGFLYPTTSETSYIGAPFIQAPKTPSASEPAIFYGDVMKNEETLPSCGNEGYNVQVVYPARATGSSYMGTYNIGDTKETGYEYQEDMSNVTYETCLTRAEDKGAPLFGLTGNRCYIIKKDKTLIDAKSARLGVELNPRASPWTRPGQKILHFGMDGTLNILNTDSPSNNPGNILYRIGLTDAEYNSRSMATCDFKTGGTIKTNTGTWGENCNSVPVYNYPNQYIGEYTDNDAASIVNISKVIENKQATNVTRVLKPDPPVTPLQGCHKTYGDCGLDNDWRFNAWINRGGSCPKDYTPRSNCSTGCGFLSSGWGGGWRCMNRD